MRTARKAPEAGVCRLAEALEPRLFLSGAEGAIIIWPAGLDDPDDEIREARRVGNGTFTDSIDSPTDVDMYVVTMAMGGTLTVDVDSPGGALDSYLRRFSPSGENTGAVNDRAGPAPEFSDRESYFIADFFPGTIYIAVSGANNAFYDPVNGGGDSNGSTGAYTITFNGLDGADPDDQTAEAVPVFGGFRYNGNIDLTDVDMFAITVRPGDTVEFDVDPFDPFDSYLRLFDASGATLAESDDDPAPGETPSGESYIRHTFVAAGTYYVGLSGFENIHYDPLTGTGDVAGARGAYTLVVTATAGMPPDRFEPNNTRATATDLGTLGRAAENDLSIHTGDADYFRFTAAGSGPITVDLAFTNAQGDLDVQLMNAAGLVISSSDGTGNGESITHKVTAGQTYYVHVYGYSGATNPDYDMVINAPGSQAPPRVAQVFVNGTAWTEAFRSYLAAQGLGDAEHGFAVPGGADQLDELPWANLNQITIRFDQPVAVDANDLSVRGVNVPTYSTTDFSYDPDSYTAIWTLNRPLADFTTANRQTEDRVRLELNGDAPDGVRAANSGGLLLDGDWTDGADTFPSGDGSSGGDFRFLLNVVPGDANRNGNVSPTDFGAVRAAIGRSATDVGSDPARSYTVFRDVNGNGNIAPTDLGVVRGNTGANIAGLPTPAALAPDSVRDELFGTSPIF